MLIEEIINCSDCELHEAKVVWARKGKQLVRKYRCTAGPRKGRIVANPSQCGAPVDQKKRILMRKLKARIGARMARKSNKTKRVNPASKRLQKLNKKD